MQPKFIMIIAGCIAVVAAAFAGGYFLNRHSSPPPQPQVAEAPAPVTQQPASVPVSQGPTATPQIAAPSQSYETTPPRRSRYHDYADREYESAPPPPPPPQQQYFDERRPDPFEGRFSTFPMRHEGNGSVDAPLSFIAQTVWGEGREADLRVSLVVPEPSPSDRGEFARQWQRGDHVDLMPDISHGTPVFVTGSAAAIVTIDSSTLDLDVPAQLILQNPDGERIYRSGDVAPARGVSWDQRGVRWIFAIDEDFYRMLRDGADASLVIRHRGRYGERDAQIPFSTGGFPDAARAFEWQLRNRMNVIAAEWERVEYGAPQPGSNASATNAPPPPAPPPQTYPPQPNQQWRPQSTPMAQTGPLPPRNPQPNAPQPPAAQQTQTAQQGNPAPNAPPRQPATPPPPSATLAQSTPTASSQTPQPAIAPGRLVASKEPGVAEKAISDFHPPTDNCGPQPPFAAADPRDYLHDTPAQLASADDAVSKVQTWLACRQQWLAGYQTGIEALRTKFGALKDTTGGAALVGDFQTARRSYAELDNSYKRHAALLARAHSRSMGKGQQPPAGSPTPQ